MKIYGVLIESATYYVRRYCGAQLRGLLPNVHVYKLYTYSIVRLVFLFFIFFFFFFQDIRLGGMIFILSQWIENSKSKLTLVIPVERFDLCDEASIHGNSRCISARILILTIGYTYNKYTKI